MTISSASTRDVVTLPNGATNTTFGFDYLSVDNIEVYYDGVLKTLGVNYTIVGQTVTFTPALVGETVVSIISNEPYGNPFDYLEPEQWTANFVNESFDRAALQIKQVLDGSIQVGPFDPTISFAELLEELETAVFDASASAIAAAVSAVLAEAWAESPTDITPGHKSAKTWAGIAQSMVIPPDTITTAMLQDECVTTDKIGGAAVTSEKIAMGIFIPITANGFRGHAINTGTPNEFMVWVAGFQGLNIISSPDFSAEIPLTDLGIGITAVSDANASGSVAIRNTPSNSTLACGGSMFLSPSPPTLHIEFYAPGFTGVPQAGFVAMFLATIP